MPGPFDFFDRLERYASRRPDDVTLRFISGDGVDDLTFRGLASEIIRLAREFARAIPARPGVHAALLMEDSHRWGVSFLAAWSAGWVVVPLDPSRDPDSLREIVEHADCAALIHSPKLEPSARAIGNAIPGLILLPDTPCANAQEAESTPLRHVPRDPGEDIAILYTGGTTGSAKGVRLTEANLFTTIRDMLAVCPVGADDNILSVLPMFHVMAVLANLLGPLYVGARVTYLDTRDPARILASFEEQGITAMLCVPQFFYVLTRRIMDAVDEQSLAKRLVFFRLLALSRFLRTRLKVRAGKMFFGPVHRRFGPKFRLFGVGAASFAPEVAERLLDLGFDLFQAYGMTETAGPVAVDPPGPFAGLTCGPPFPHARIRIHQPNEDGIGEILVAGDAVTPGYWKNPAATAELIHDGWLWTGDLGFLDAAGKLRVTGRRKEVIVLSSGKNVFPEQVEYQLQKSSSYIRELCVVATAASGGPTSGGKERLHAVVVPDFDRLKADGVANVRDQIRYDIDNASRALLSWQRVRSFEIREAPLPRTSTRKLKRFEVEPRFAAPDAANGHAATGSEPELFTLIRRIKPGCGPIHDDSHLELDLGLDSLEIVELLSNLRARFGVEIRDEDASRISTVGDLAKRIEAAQPSTQKWVGWSDILNAPLTPRQAAETASNLQRRPLFEAGMFAVCRVARVAARILLRFRITGAGHLPDRGPFILCANHASYLDALLIAAALPWSAFSRLFFLSARKYMRSGFQRWFGRMMRAIAVETGGRGADALRLGAEGLSKGMVLCVFPEGHRSIDGSLLPFHHGPAILSVEQRVPIVPVGLSGTQNVWGRASRSFRLAPVRVSFGEPIHPLAHAEYEKITARLRASISELIGT